MNDDTEHRWVKSAVLAGVSGGLGALLSNPFFIVKTRFQGHEGAPGSMGGLRGHLVQMGRQEGAAAYFKGSLSTCTLPAEVVRRPVCVLPSSGRGVGGPAEHLRRDQGQTDQRLRYE